MSVLVLLNRFRYQEFHRWLRVIMPYTYEYGGIRKFDKASIVTLNLISRNGNLDVVGIQNLLAKEGATLYSNKFDAQNNKSNAKKNSRHFGIKMLSVLFGAGLSVSLLYNATREYCSIDSNRRNIWKAFAKSMTVSAATPFGDLISRKDSNTSDGSTSSQKPPGKRFTYNFIADVVEKVSDGVVFIEIKDNRRRDSFGNVLAMSNGSGFLVDSEGLILTNAHVVANKPRASTIMVRLADGREFEGRIEDFDAVSDLALVKIKCAGLKPLNLGSSKDVRPGEFVVALGSPLSLSNTITSGVVSSIGRASKDLGLRGKDIQYIQTDAAITFGNSGGPLVNLDGEVIAINSMKVTSGISFAIPVDYAKDFLDKVSKKRSFLGKYKKEESMEETVSKRRYLGITMLSLTPEVISQMQQRSPESIIPPNVTHGILVWRLVVGSPAYHAGLEPGDIVTHINGHEVHSSRDVYKYLESKSDLQMVVNRKGERYTVTVTPEE